METQEGLRIDRENYQEAYPNYSTPSLFEPKSEPRPKRKRSTKVSRPVIEIEPEPEAEFEYEETSYEPEPQYNHVSHHNEIEDFLL